MEVLKTKKKFIAKTRDLKSKTIEYHWIGSKLFFKQVALSTNGLNAKYTAVFLVWFFTHQHLQFMCLLMINVFEA